MADAPEDPVASDEQVYRTFFDKVGWWDSIKRSVYRQAFEPSDADTNGLSVVRARFHTPLQVAAIKHRERLARNKAAEPLVVVEVSVAALREKGLDVVPDPLPEIPGHAVIPLLNNTQKKGQVGKQRQLDAVASCIKIHGPFDVATLDDEVQRSADKGRHDA